MAKHPYLKPNRLADVIAAVQCMAISERSSRSCEEWAERISGDVSKAIDWRAVFDEHSELFRKSPDDAGHYALIWRRALPRRYSRLDKRMLTEAEYDALSDEEQHWVSRPPVPESQVKTLVDVAITLHARQWELRRDWRWWVPIAGSFIGATLGALATTLGVLATALGTN